MRSGNIIGRAVAWAVTLTVPLLAMPGATAAQAATEAQAATDTAPSGAGAGARGATGGIPDAALPAATVEAARMAEVLARVPVSGTLVARQQAQVFAQVTGYEIREILVETGDRVEAGQVLARLATETLAAMLAQAEAEDQRAAAAVSQAQSLIDSADATLTQARTALERAVSLSRNGTTSQAALDQAVASEAGARATAASARDGLAVARAQRAQAAAALRIARLNLARAQITAPVAGLVVARTAERGALAGGSAAPLFTLIADGQIEMQAEVIETALGRLKAGNPASIDVAGVGTVAGRVRLVPVSVDAATRLGLMRIALDDVEGLRLGLFANGWVVTDRRDAVTVPATAVLADAQGERVQTVDGAGVIRTRPVRAGLLWEGRREIIEGVAVGERVIVRAGAFFRDGDRVQAVSGAAAAPTVAVVAGAPRAVAADDAGGAGP